MTASYLDFDLEIGQGQSQEYPLTIRSPAGETRETMQFPLDHLARKTRLLEMENALLRSGGPPQRTLSTGQQMVRTFDHSLFNTRSSPERSAVGSTPAKSALSAKVRDYGYDFTAWRQSNPLCPGSFSMAAARITF